MTDDDPLSLAPEMVPFVTGEELLRRREAQQQGGVQHELSEADLAFLRRQAERATRERARLERPRQRKEP